LNFAVATDCQRRGVGHQMVQKLVGKLSSHRRTRIQLHCRESALQAQLFFRTQQFKASQILREHFEDTGEDAYVLNYTYIDSILEDRAGKPVNRIARQLEG
jgi:ribosomal-protein-alanine N-acetyltransferase